MAKILIVDDELATNVVLSKALARAGHQTRTAFTGKDALERLRAEPFDLVLTDLRMPQLDGFALLEQLQREELPARPPVIVVTAYHDRPTYKRASELGAVDFIGKPFELAELLLRVERALGRGPRGRGEGAGPTGERAAGGGAEQRDAAAAGAIAQAGTAAGDAEWVTARAVPPESYLHLDPGRFGQAAPARAAEPAPPPAEVPLGRRPWGARPAPAADLLEVAPEAGASAAAGGGAGSAGRPAAAGVDCAGTLGALALAELVRLLHLGRHSGRLTLHSEDEELQATVLVQQGEVVGARLVRAGSEQARGPEALRQLLGWRRGRFTLRLEPVAGQAEFGAPTSELLAEHFGREG
ncbi:MAG: hypothetical protein KatS3mg102_1877 [Planctomycetota bacterium]|nr:MAG: hypothetical protein KatS3mg102_1877 [Planctomycetota bacterium]